MTALATDSAPPLDVDVQAIAEVWADMDERIAAEDAKAAPTVHPRLAGRFTITESGCWEWTGAIDRHGYGFLSVDNRKTKVHRFAYETSVGPIPDGLPLDHLCRVRHCVNPAHLEVVTVRENTLRGFEARDRVGTRLGGTCKRGHPFDAENTRFSANGRRRSCRACSRARRQEWQATNRTA